MKTLSKINTALVLLSLAASAHAEVVVKDAWIRATVPQQKVGGVFLQIESSSDAKLIEAHSDAAASAELHEMKLDNNIMRMRAIEQLALPAGKPVDLKPGGYHLMLMGLKNQVKVGDVIPLTLVIENKDKKRQTVQVKVIAKPINAN
jgi:copper(I)-binding protein